MFADQTMHYLFQTGGISESAGMRCWRWDEFQLFLADSNVKQAGGDTCQPFRGEERATGCQSADSWSYKKRQEGRNQLKFTVDEFVTQ